MRLRRGALAVILTAAVAVPTVGAATVAAAAKPGSGSVAVSKKPAAKPTTKPVAKPAKKIKFSATGTVVEAAAGTVKVKVQGGTKEVRGKTITVTVPASLRVLINGAKKKATDLAAGYSITVTGTGVGNVYTADKVIARKVAKPAPTTTPAPTIPAPTTPAPTATPAPTPSTTPTTDPSDDDATPEPTETPEP